MGKVYTKTGDNGTTGLIGGKRVEKHNPQLEAYGTVDELNSFIGLIRAFEMDKHERDVLEKVQSMLFTVGAHLAVDDEHPEMKDKFTCSSHDVELLESEIDSINGTLPEMNCFVLPGGSQLVSYTHIARTVCRRAERRITELTNVNVFVVKYINRLSDYLFVLSRKFAVDNKVVEVPWLS